MRLLWVIAAFVLYPFAGLACGAQSDCIMDMGTYRIALPEGTEAPLGAIVFAHGYQGSAKTTMRNKSLIRMATDRGLAFIALDALDEDWDLPNSPGGEPKRDEMAYLDAVIADAGARFGILPEKSVVTGFSAGGMFTWTAVCERGDAFGGFIPYSGTFWKEPPKGCRAGAANVVHVHGDADRTVPLEGRAIADTRQGSVPDTLAMYRADKGFAGAAMSEVGDMRCERAVNAAGKHLDFCLFAGDHSFPSSRLGAAYDLLQN